MISSGDDEESDETLVSVDDEVSSHLFCFFVMLDELGGRESFEITSSRLHSFEKSATFLGGRAETILTLTMIGS